jgi:hypothetical protein
MTTYATRMLHTSSHISALAWFCRHNVLACVHDIYTCISTLFILYIYTHAYLYLHLHDTCRQDPSIVFKAYEKQHLHKYIRICNTFVLFFESQQLTCIFLYRCIRTHIDNLQTPWTQDKTSMCLLLYTNCAYNPHTHIQRRAKQAVRRNSCTETNNDLFYLFFTTWWFLFDEVQIAWSNFQISSAILNCHYIPVHTNVYVHVCINVCA